MSSFHVRPRFEQIVALAPETLREKIARHATKTASRCDVKSFPGYLSLRILEEDEHFWSPQLNLSLDPVEEGKTQVTGIYGPNTNVWSLFLYGYLTTGCLALVGTVLGVSQWALGHPPWAFVLLVFALAGVAGLYLFAQTGQKVGAQQTFHLHQVYEDAVGEPVTIH